MPELPEVETTRARPGAASSRQARDRGHAAPTRPALADSAGDRRAVAGPADHRPSAVAPSTCCWTPTPGSALLHLGMSGSLRVLPARTPVAGARPRGPRAGLGQGAALHRSAPLRLPALATGGQHARTAGRASVPSRCRKTSDGDYLFERSRGRSRQRQDLPDGPGHRGRRRQHLCRREPVPRRDRARARRRPRVSCDDTASWQRPYERSCPRDRARRHHPARLHQPGRRCPATSSRSCSCTAARASPAAAAAALLKGNRLGNRATAWCSGCQK